MALSVRLIGLLTLAVLVTQPALSAGARDSEVARPAQKIAFPPIKDWSSLHIRLQRTACYGWCPVYTVEIAGDGAVSYFGERFVATKGGKSWTIPPDKVRDLYQAFVKADFFWSFDQYEAPITDLPTHIVSISFDDHSKSVTDYAGQRAGMPAAFEELEQTIDAVAGTAAVVGHEREP